METLEKSFSVSFAGHWSLATHSGDETACRHFTIRSKLASAQVEIFPSLRRGGDVCVEYAIRSYADVGHGTRTYTHAHPIENHSRLPLARLWYFCRRLYRRRRRHTFADILTGFGKAPRPPPHPGIRSCTTRHANNNISHNNTTARRNVYTPPPPPVRCRRV